nr:uncharacterized protein LOC129444508 isoform X2 [Misgurnus anguillicaudatus]
MEASNNSREQNSDIESAVRNLLSCIRRHSNPQAHGSSNISPTVAPQPGTSASFSVGQAAPQPGTSASFSVGQAAPQPGTSASFSVGQAAPQPGTSASFGVGQAVSRPSTVQQEMQRAFPALYHGNRKRMKKMAPVPAKVTSVKFLEFQFCLLSNNSQKTPKDETVPLQAGLGRRTVNIPDNADHTEITKVLLQEYPKLQNIKGGWLLQKASGGSGQRKTTSLAQDSQGYTTKILKTSSNNGKNVIYIVPLQEEIDIVPLPYDAPEFHNMPKNICMTCGTSVPLQLLPCHLEDCQSNNAVSDISVSFTKK